MNWRRPLRLALFAFLLVGVLVAPLAAPQLLAFPYRAKVNLHSIRAVGPIPPSVRAAVEAADMRVRLGPLSQARPADQPIFLTGGGWRWQWLAAGTRGSMALTRALNEAIIVNRLDVTGRDVLNGATVGGRRGLAGVIAHEMTHGSIRAHFGMGADRQYPRALREGFCDYVAGEGSLSDDVARRLLGTGVSHPALIYWQGRKRIETEMAKPGMTVDTLFANWRERPAD